MADGWVWAVPGLVEDWFRSSGETLWDASGVAQGGVYPGVGDRLVVAQARGVEAEQDLDAVPGPLGDPWAVPGCQPEGDSRVPQVVGAACQGRGDLGRGGVRVRMSAHTSLMAVEATGCGAALDVPASRRAALVACGSGFCAPGRGRRGHAGVMGSCSSVTHLSGSSGHSRVSSRTCPLLR
jgi:hypothetical protein